MKGDVKAGCGTAQRSSAKIKKNMSTHWLPNADSMTAACGVLTSKEIGSRSAGTTDPDEIECESCWKHCRNPTSSRKKIVHAPGRTGLSKCRLASMAGEAPGKITCKRCLRAKKGAPWKKWRTSVQIGKATLYFSLNNVMIKIGWRYVVAPMDSANRIGFLLENSASGICGEVRIDAAQTEIRVARGRHYIALSPEDAARLGASLAGTHRYVSADSQKGVY